MRTSVAVAVCVLTSAGAATAATPVQTARPTSATLSSRHAGARPVRFAVALTYEMQCGYPGPGPVVVSFTTKGWRVPARVAPSAVLVNGKPASSVSVTGRTVNVGLPPRPHIMCDAIGPGVLTLQFTRAANLGNPLSAGVAGIAIAVQSKTLLFPVTFAIIAS